MIWPFLSLSLAREKRGRNDDTDGPSNRYPIYDPSVEERTREDGRCDEELVCWIKPAPRKSSPIFLPLLQHLFFFPSLFSIASAFSGLIRRCSGGTQEEEKPSSFGYRSCPDLASLCRSIFTGRVSSVIKGENRADLARRKRERATFHHPSSHNAANAKMNTDWLQIRTQLFRSKDAHQKRLIPTICDMISNEP